MSSSGAHDWHGQTLSKRYHVIETLGVGGMGTVFKASDTRLGVDVVIKVPHPMMIKNTEFAARFRREIRSLVQLSHPNIVKVTDVGEHDRLPFAVLQFLSGGSLEDRPRPCTPEDVAAWLPDAAAALDFMHGEGMIHRDIKPGNILFDSNGRAYLADFGIAKVIAEDGEAEQKLTGTGMLIGTAEYMAPEMLVPAAFQETYGERGDQYSLAVTLYEMLSGRPPFRGDSMAEVAVLLATKGATPLSERNSTISDSVSHEVARALQKKPENRFENCSTFARSFVAAVHGERRVELAEPSSEPQRVRVVPAAPPQATQIEWPTGDEPAESLVTTKHESLSRPTGRKPSAETQPKQREPTRKQPVGARRHNLRNPVASSGKNSPVESQGSPKPVRVNRRIGPLFVMGGLSLLTSLVAVYLVYLVICDQEKIQDLGPKILVLNAIAFMLGVIGLFEKERERAYALWGLVIAGCITFLGCPFWAIVLI